MGYQGSKRLLAIAAGILGLLIIAGVAGLVWYLNQPVPDEVTLESAVADVASSQPPDDGVTDPTLSNSQTDGAWIVDVSIGEFSFEEATSSFVGFRIKEELATVGATTAVGRTPVVGGTLTLAGTTVTELAVEADLTKIVTNASRRDRAVQRALNTGSFPISTFALTAPIDIGGIPAEGEPVQVVAVGDLEINGVSRAIEIPLESQLVGGLIVVVGGVDISFADWSIEMPSAPGVVSVEDHGILEIQLFFSRN